MIRHIKLLQNIGTFNSDSAAASLALKKLSLIYGDNARGKTTIAAVLRSLAKKDPMPIEERRRFGSQHPPKVALVYEGEPSDVLFQDGAWNKIPPNIRVFDERFVDENVYSGLDVDASHRQNLHQLVLGELGVELNGRLQDLVSRITKHNSDLELKAKAIPETERFGLLANEFCALPMVSDMDKQIEDSERTLMAAQDQDAVLKAPLFETVEMPKLNVEAIKGILSKGLSTLDKEAEAQVLAHVRALGEGGESWVADGMRRGEKGGGGVCPFCGQGLSGLALLAHYRAYFSAGYAQLRRDAEQSVEDFANDHAEATLVAFDKAVVTAQQSSQFWARYCDVPSIEVNTESVRQDWSAARDLVLGLLKSKQESPLEQLKLDKQALEAIGIYEARRVEILGISQTCMSFNETIKQVKGKAGTANTTQLAQELNKLRATKARYSAHIDPLCQAYLQEQEAKTCTEKARAQARIELDDYRTSKFPELEDKVNSFLDKFNAGFRVASLVHSNIGGGSGSTCTYNVVINDTPVPIRNSSNPPGEPSFRNTLSAGDRNTLALALFFSALSQSPSLADTIVVIDDPMSSLDDHRSLATIQTIRQLVQEVNQVIVLSHNKRFLCGIWNGSDRKECLGLEVAQKGDESTMRIWNVSQDATTEHDQRFFLLRGYASVQSGDKQQVAMAIRLHIEGFLRVACPGQFPPGQLLGPFMKECNQKLGIPEEVIGGTAIGELEDIVEYANRFHHDTNPAWETEDINPTELAGFVQRTLAFVGPKNLL